MEMVQRRADIFVSWNYRRQTSVGAMLQSLGWDTLQQRRNQAKAVMMYKIIIYNLVAIDSLPFYHLKNNPTAEPTCVCTDEIIIPHCHLHLELEDLQDQSSYYQL